jgi:hypothetical protein
MFGVELWGLGKRWIEMDKEEVEKFYLAYIWQSQAVVKINLLLLLPFVLGPSGPFPIRINVELWIL